MVEGFELLKKLCIESIRFVVYRFFVVALQSVH